METSLMNKMQHSLQEFISTTKISDSTRIQRTNINKKSVTSSIKQVIKYYQTWNLMNWNKQIESCWSWKAAADSHAADLQQLRMSHPNSSCQASFSVCVVSSGGWEKWCEVSWWWCVALITQPDAHLFTLSLRPLFLANKLGHKTPRVASSLCRSPCLLQLIKMTFVVVLLLFILFTSTLSATICLILIVIIPICHLALLRSDPVWSKVSLDWRMSDLLKGV